MYRAGVYIEYVLYIFFLYQLMFSGVCSSKECVFGRFFYKTKEFL